MYLEVDHDYYHVSVKVFYESITQYQDAYINPFSFEPPRTFDRVEKTYPRPWLPKALIIIAKDPLYEYYESVLNEIYAAFKQGVISGVFEEYLLHLAVYSPEVPRGLAKFSIPSLTL